MVTISDVPARPAANSGKSLLLGVVFGIDTIGHCVALATLAFSGPLAFALGYGSMLILFSSAAIAFVLAWRSVFPAGIGMAEDTTIAILAPAMVLAAASVSGSPEEQLATAIAIMGISTLLSGAAIFSIGRFRLGRIARILPFPVAAGFLAGSGWLLVASALFLLTDTGSLVQLGAQIGSRGVPLNLLLGACLVLGFFVAGRIVSGALVIVLPLMLAIVLFYGGLNLAGLTVEDARMMRLLPAMTGGSLSPLPDFGLVTYVNWPVVASASLTITVIVLLNSIGFLLNVGGVEMAVRADISIDAEARTTGAANIVIGSLGGLAGWVASDTSIIAHKLGCNSRLLGLTIGATTLVGCIFAGWIVSHLPVFVAAGLLLYFGLAMISDWLIRPWARLRPLDWAIIPVILGITILTDILAAIIVGVLLALVIFVYNYARLPVIRFSGTGLTRRSPVDRSPSDEVTLSARGGRVTVLSLQGYLFFGSVEKVIDAVRKRMAQPDPVEMLIIDFTHVTGLDSAACAAFLKLGLLGETGRFRIAFAAVPDGLADTMRRWRIGGPDDATFSYFLSLGAALEEVEEELLRVHGTSDGSGETLLQRLEAEMPRAADLLARMERLDAAPGYVLIRAGNTDGDIYFIEQGRVNVQIAAPPGLPTDLRSLRAGAVVGEAARYLGRIRTADVVVHTHSVIWRLTEAAIDRLEQEDRDLAAMLHAFMARSLAEKVDKTNRLLAAALR